MHSADQSVPVTCVIVLGQITPRIAEVEFWNVIVYVN